MCIQQKTYYLKDQEVKGNCKNLLQLELCEMAGQYYSKDATYNNDDISYFSIPNAENNHITIKCDFKKDIQADDCMFEIEADQDYSKVYSFKVKFNQF
jgi:hypothetical protein